MIDFNLKLNFPVFICTKLGAWLYFEKINEMYWVILKYYSVFLMWTIKITREI